jgi:nucleoside-diphosphate-sugar epimerase
MKYLVTGADGFLGRHFLAELARRGIPTRAMLQEGAPDAELPGEPEVVRAELLRPPSLPPAVRDITHVIHLAARVHVMDESGSEEERAFHEVNVEGTRRLLEAAGGAGVTHFLLMSSVKAMAEGESGVRDESAPARPRTPYGRSKLEAENVMFELGKALNIHAVALRLPMVYGPGAKGNVLRLLQAADKGRRLPFGRIRNRRSMVYVGNVVDAALTALESPRSNGQVYLTCDERVYSTRELYAAICQAMGKEPLLRNTPVWLLKVMGVCGSLAGTALRRPMPVNRGVIRRIAGDLHFRPEKIRRELGFVPAVSLEEGIRRTVEWYLAGCLPTPPAGPQ